MYFFNYFLIYDYNVIFCFYFYFVISVRSTKSDHVKTNVVYKLHRVSKFEFKILEEFKYFFTPNQYSKCLKKCKNET